MTLSVERITRALAIAQEIERLQVELQEIVGGKTTAVTPSPTTSTSGARKAGRPRKIVATGPSAPKKSNGNKLFSQEARQRMAAAQSARWAKYRGEAPAKNGAVAPTPAAKSQNNTSTKAAKTKKNGRSAKASKSLKVTKASVSASGRGKFTPEWRAKLAEAARLRWAKARSAKA